MKFFAITAFLFLPLLSHAIPTAEIYPWAGDYEVTKRVQCPDHELEPKANLKNFPWFRIEAGLIDVVNKLPARKRTFG